MTSYYGVVGNRDYIKLAGQRGDGNCGVAGERAREYEENTR